MRLLVVALCALTLTWTQARSDAEADAARTVAELIGAPVFAHGGMQIGEVSEVFLDQDGAPERVRIETDTLLGLGSSTIELSREAFVALRGAIVVELSADELRQLPRMKER